MYRITPRFSAGLGASFRVLLGKPEALFNELAVSVAARYRLPLRGNEEAFRPAPVRPSLLKLSNAQFDEIFPAFYQYYDDQPIGRAVVENGETVDVRDLKISVLIKQYMDQPKVTTVEQGLKRGESREVELYALFNDRVLEITEGTKVAAEVQVEYTVNGAVRKGSLLETVRLNHRNASIWDDDRRAAAFVTAKDPAVLRLSKTVAGLVRSQDNQALDGDLRTAMAIHQALGLYGMSYVVDPKTPYKESVKNRQAIDFLQFPRQTLEYKAGDCDDLSILTCALLESVSVDTAFITVPGHIYIAFAARVPPDKVRDYFLEPEDLILRDDRVWVPLEVTQIQGGFLRAWSEGARTWRENTAADKAGFFPLAEAWKLFEPVGLPGDSARLDFPAADAVQRTYEREFDRFLRRETEPRIAEIQREIQQGGASARSVNKLGVLYARYGILDSAEREFRRILARESYLPAMINLANTLYLKRELTQALSIFSEAARRSPEHPAVLLGLARVNHEMENYNQVRQSYERLARVSPSLAEQHSYLAQQGDQAARAGERSRGETPWQE